MWRRSSTPGAGRPSKPVATALEAVRLLDTTDFLNARGRARCDLAEVLVLADRPDEAGPIFQEAGRLFEQKGNLVSGERARFARRRAVLIAASGGLSRSVTGHGSSVRRAARQGLPGWGN